MAYVALWLLCGLIAAFIYHQKGSPSFGGFLSGAILGPFGLLLTLFTQQMGNAVTKTCPFCQSAIPQAATVCRYCQSDQPDLT